MEDNNYTAIALTNEQVGSGALSLITNTVSDMFFQSGQWAVANRDLHPTEHQVSILFDAGWGEPSRYPDVGTGMVLYANDEAMRILQNIGLNFQVLEEHAEPPRVHGNILNMVVWR